MTVCLLLTYRNLYPGYSPLKIQADGHGNRSVGRYDLFPPLPIQIAQDEKAVESL
jgi:hypothetical protein